MEKEEFNLLKERMRQMEIENASLRYFEVWRNFKTYFEEFKYKDL